MAKQQKSRAKKESKGIHGGGGKGRPLTDIEKVLLGGGVYRSIRDNKTKRAKSILIAKGHDPASV